MKKQTLLLVVATIAIFLGSYGSSFAKKNLKAENYKVLQIHVGTDSLALCIVVTPASLGFSGEMTRYEDLRAKVEGNIITIESQKFVVECCPPGYPELFYESYTDHSKTGFYCFVISQLGTDFFMLRVSEKGRWLDHFLPQPSIPMLRSVDSKWSSEGEFVFHLKKA